MRVVLERLADRTVDLAERAIGGVRVLRERPRQRVTRNRCASGPSANEPASQPGHTTPPALALKAPRCSRSPQAAQAASSGAKPAASSSLVRNASA